MARYRSWPAVSQICAFIVFPSTWMLLVANSTPMVLLLSRLNSLRVKRDRRLLFPTPESPINTTERRDIIFTINSLYQHWPHAAVQPGRQHPPEMHSQITQERLTRTAPQTLLCTAYFSNPRRAPSCSVVSSCPVLRGENEKLLQQLSKSNTALEAPTTAAGRVKRCPSHTRPLAQEGCNPHFKKHYRQEHGNRPPVFPTKAFVQYKCTLFLLKDQKHSK